MNKIQLESLFLAIDRLVCKRLKHAGEDQSFEEFEEIRRDLVKQIAPIICSKETEVRSE